MSKLQSFDFNSLKKMTIDNLIMICKKYVRQYSSKSVADRLDKAYKSARFYEVKHILEETLKRLKMKIKISEYQKVEQDVLNEFSDTKKLFDSSENSERRKKENMGTGSGIIAVIIIIIVAILVIATVIAVKHMKVNNKTVGEVLNKKKINNIPQYTDKDRDMVSLIHELSIIYDNTDQYLSS